MSSVTNQLPYSEIKTFPAPKEVCPRLRRGVERVAIAIAITGISVGMGVGVGLSTLPISIGLGAMSAGVIGLVMSVAIAKFKHFPSNVENYRMETLKSMRGATGNPKALAAIRDLCDFFYYPFDTVERSGQLHQIHKALCRITDFIDPSRNDARQAWGAFLKHLDKAPLRYTDGEIFFFSTRVEQERFQGKLLGSKAEWFSFWNRPSDEDIEQIAALSRECLGKAFLTPFDRIKRALTEEKSSGCIVSRDPQNGKILGACWYTTETGVVQIRELLRKPEAARLGIGAQLLSEVLEANKGKRVQAIFPQKNAFLQRLLQIGFKGVMTLPAFYPEAEEEKALLLEIDWKAYQEKITER